MNLDEIEVVAEWARQWRLNPNIDKSGTIYNVWFDPESSAVELNLNDIEALLALVREQQARLDAVLDLANWAGKHGWTLDAAAIRKALEATA
jgi:hypothetical protein